MDVLKRTMLAGVIAAFTVGCGDDGTGEEADVEACQHLQSGPSTSVDATPVVDSAPVIADDHMRYDVSLLLIRGHNSGFVRFDADEAADYVVFTDVEAPIKVSDSDGAAVEIDSSVGSEVCSEIRGRHVVPLTVGTHYFFIGPIAVGEIGVVVEPLAHGHDD